jgi:hypothetical protein
MDVISTTINYKGSPITIKNGKVFVYQFGTTIHRQNTPHYSLIELPQDKMKDEFKDYLKENNLI